MNCTKIPLPGGGFAIACGRGHRLAAQRCRWCTLTPGAFQCDWKTGNGTCDKHLCAQHAFQVGPDKHICPEHVLAYREYLRELCIPLG